jgi:hypothetical protein
VAGKARYLTQVVPYLDKQHPPDSLENREDTVDDTITTIYCLCDDFLRAIARAGPIPLGPEKPEPKKPTTPISEKPCYR